MSAKKAYIHTIVARTSLIAGQLVYVKLVTHFLDMPQVGVYYLLVTASYFANALIFVPFDYLQQSTITSTYTSTQSLRRYLRPNLIILSIFLAVISLCAFGSVFFSSDAASWIVIAAMFSIGNYIPVALRGALNILGYTNKVNTTQLVEGIFRPALGLVFVTVVEHPNAIILLASGCSASLIMSGYLYKTLLDTGALKRPTAANVEWSWQKVLKLAFPISASAITNWIQLQGYRIILVPMGYADAVGVYSVMSNLGHAGMGAINGIYSQVTLPRVYKSHGRELNKYLMGVIGLTLVAAFSLFALAPVMVPLVTNKSYTAFSSLAVFGVFIDGLAATIGGLIVYFSIKGRTVVVASSGICAASISCLGMYALYLSGNITPFTIGMILMISQCVSAYLLYIAYRKLRSNNS